MLETPQDVGEEQVHAKGVKKVPRKGVTPTPSKAVKSSKSCAGNFFLVNPLPYQERTKGMWVMTDRRGVHPYCKNASNPYHKCAKYCFKNISKRDQPGQVLKLKSVEGDKISSIRGRTSLQPQCIFASNPQHECTEVCFQNGPDSNTREGALNPKEEIETLVAAESGVKLMCKNEHPYHIHDEYCFQNLPEDHDLEAMMIAKEEKEVVSIPQTEMNSSCENVSELYIEYYFKNVPEMDKPELAVMKSKEENKVSLLGERWVNPECQFASNPYHVGAEYCFQNAFDEGSSRHVMKLRKLRKTVSNKETTTGHSWCKFASNPYHECGAGCFQNEHDQNKVEGVTESKEGKKESSYAQRRDVNTKYNFASNIFHKCTEYCSVEYPDRNQPVECMTVITKEENRNSPSEMRYHLIMEKSAINLEFVEASNIDSDYAEFSEGITMQVVNKDLMPEVEMKITKESSEVQSLQSDASDLFLEWAKYCFQEKAAEYKIFMPVERKAFATKNGKDNDNLKYYDSSNLEKVKAKRSLQRSLLTSVLFFIGYLFALFKWTQVLHSLVKSSVRKNSRRV